MTCKCNLDEGMNPYPIQRAKIVYGVGGVHNEMKDQETKRIIAWD
jgi:hypothetical protein